MSQIELVAALLGDAPAVALEEGARRQRFRDGLRTPTTSGSSHSPGTMPRSRIRSRTTWIPSSGKRRGEGSHSPTLSHQPSVPSSYQPESMQKYSDPASAAASISGSSFSVVGSPISVFM